MSHVIQAFSLGDMAIDQMHFIMSMKLVIPSRCISKIPFLILTGNAFYQNDKGGSPRPNIIFSKMRFLLISENELFFVK